MFRRNVAALLCLVLCAGVVAARPAFAQPAAPLLIAEEGTDRAVAVEPVTRARDPFPSHRPPPSARTRARASCSSRRTFSFSPARHFASSNTDPNLPPMGMRVRLKASFDIAGYSPAMQVVLRALKKYGMILADNGSNWYVSGAPDARWNDSGLNTLKGLKGSDFEVVKMGTVVTE